MNEINVIPQPNSVRMTDGCFELKSNSKIIVSFTYVIELGKLLAEYLCPATGFTLDVKVGVGCGPNDIFLNLNEGASENSEKEFPDESYSISISPDGIELGANTATGLAQSIQTLRQLFPVEIFRKTTISEIDWIIPAIEIEDSPEYLWRGMHLDVSRHFFSVEDVCRFIDLIALHRYNKFHWHLTDDQGWRIEIKRYPKLTEVGGRREYTLKGHMDDRPRRYDDKPYSGYYTQDDICRVVDYATQRHITVIPEIDMPGHMQAAIAAYPELGCDPYRKTVPRSIWGVSQNILCPSEFSIEFMKNVMKEVIELFPSPFIHIGGDEAVKHVWEESRTVQEIMAVLNINDENTLQNYFLGEINKFLKNNGKRAIGWDEILESQLPAGTIIMSWRDHNGAIEAAKRGHESIMAECEFSYFDFCQGNPDEEPLAQKTVLSLEKVYNHNLIPESLPEKHRNFIIGGQGQLWTEYIPDIKHLEYMAFPRTVALAEKLWCSHSDCSYDNFKQRLDYHIKRLDLMNVNYRK